MSPNIVILALFFYPLLYVLPLNFVRFQWGYKGGLAPMPPELEKKAEAIDRVVLFVTHLTLVVVIFLLMQGSPISAYEVGLTLDNWKAAFGMGAMLSLLAMGLISLLLSNVPPQDARKELDSRGPVATWCGLLALGSFSTEFWRAFCLVALIRLGVFSWLAIVIVAVFFAVIQLQNSIGRALGAATFGGAAGFLFIKTGSLLAPLTMSLMVGIAHLYEGRRGLASITRLGRPESRYSRPCPVCGALIRFLQVNREGDILACPECGESLTTEKKYLWVVGALSVAAAIYATRHLVYREPLYAIVTEGLAFVLFFIGAFLLGLLVPPKYKRVWGGNFD